MTKIVNLLGITAVPEDKKPIELVHELLNSGEIVHNTTLTTKHYDYITLIDRDSDEGAFDVICGWSDDNLSDEPVRRTIFLGHWNDGVV